MCAVRQTIKQATHLNQAGEMFDKALVLCWVALEKFIATSHLQQCCMQHFLHVFLLKMVDADTLKRNDATGNLLFYPLIMHEPF